MIKFFRKIRQQLLTENKFNKYILYAIGEIILVVIGILIALQINNWNEDRKAAIFEKKLLADIVPFIENNIWQLETSITHSKKYIKSAEIILDHIEENRPYHDSLGHHFSNAISWFHPTIENSGFESLKTYGMNSIQNDTLRKRLGDIYGSDRWFKILNSRQEEYFYSTASPILTELFESVEFGEQGGTMKPNSFEELRNSKKYNTILRTSISNRNNQIYWCSNWLKMLHTIEKMVIKELKENKK